MSVFDDLFDLIAEFPGRHATTDAMWRVWKAVALPAIKAAFGAADASPQAFGPFGPITMPYFKMGNIDLLDLFGLDELIIFAFYNANRKRYRRIVDFGANIGLHTIMLARCGFEVRSFEPDPFHFERLKANLALNSVTSDLRLAAVSSRDGEAEFVRVLGNTTSSHIKGAKADPYGPTEVFKVKLEAAQPHLAWANLAKIDIEGHEAALLTSLPHDTWRSTDAILEVGTEDNAHRIFEYFRLSGVNIFAQKVGWTKVTALSDMPTSHRDGSLFVTRKSAMPWH